MCWLCRVRPAAGLEEGLLKLCTCLANSREEHMIRPDDSDDESSGEEGDSSGSEEESDSGSEHDSGEPKAANSSGSEPEAGEANGHDAEGGGSHGGVDDRHAAKDKDSKKVSEGAVQLLAGHHGCVLMRVVETRQFWVAYRRWPLFASGPDMLALACQHLKTPAAYRAGSICCSFIACPPHLLPCSCEHRCIHPLPTCAGPQAQQEGCCRQ